MSVRRAGPRFPCVRCGTPIRREDGDPKRLRCPVCRYRIYDYPRPAAGVVVVKGPDVLVLTRNDPPKRGCWDIPGGFMDAGESIEGAARRELREETGLTVGAMTPAGLYWDRYFLKGFGYFPTMNFYFVAHWRRGVPVAADDAARAEWMPLARARRETRRHAWQHMAALLGAVPRLLRGGRASG